MIGQRISVAIKELEVGCASFVPLGIDHIIKTYMES